MIFKGTNEVRIIVKAAQKGGIGYVTAVCEHFFRLGNTLGHQIFRHRRSAILTEETAELIDRNVAGV